MKTNSLVMLLLLLLGMNSAADENNQTVVIGIGAGIHNFSESDELRKSLFFSEIGIAGASHLYVEWYVFDQLGVGLRLTSLGVTETVMTSFTTYEREFAISNRFVTLNWVPVGAAGYARLGVLAGIGQSEYGYTTRTNGTVTYDNSSSGPATMLGGFVDWGGKDFGARISLNVVNTDLDKLEGYKVSASGSNWNLDLRWAFE